MGTRHNPMVVTAVLRLGGRLDLDALHTLVATRALGLPRMRARIVVPWLGTPRWEEPTALRPEMFVTQLPPLASNSDERALADLVAEIAATPLDFTRPPWHLWSIDDASGATTIVARIHHAIADGVSLLGVLFALSDEGAGVVPITPSSSRIVASGFGDLFSHTPKTRRPRALSRPLGGHKRFAWSRAFPLTELRQRAHAFSAHVNDVLLASIGGALREFLLRRGESPDAPLRALVPIALPHADSVGNQFVSAFVPIPVHLEHPVARLMAARDAMRAARTKAGLGLGRMLVWGTSLTTAVGGRLGGFLERAGVLAASRGVSLVASDLAGPPIPLHFGSVPITSILFASPVPGTVPIAFSAFGYAGSLRITVSVDDTVVGDPWELVSGLEDDLT